MSAFLVGHKDNADWLQQALESYVARDIDSILSSIPDNLKIQDNPTYRFISIDTEHQVLRHSSRTLSIHLDRVMRFLVEKYSNCHITLQLYHQRILETALRVSIVDLPTDIYNGSLKITKNIDNSKYQHIVKQSMPEAATTPLRSLDGSESFDRVNKVLSILGDGRHGILSHSSTDKHQLLISRVENIITNDEWKIRDLSLAESLGSWIFGYVKYGDQDSLDNLLRLRSLVDEDVCLYSMRTLSYGLYCLRYVFIS